GPVNWKLAAEIAKHLSGERQPVEPWAAEEFRELARLAEYRVGEVAPFPVRPAHDVLPLDPRGWAEKNLESYAPLVEPFGASMAGEEAEPLIAQLAPVMIGMQVGGLVGSLSTWIMASFDAGLPPERPGAIHLVVPNITSFVVPDVDRREVNLWVATNEVAFRSISDIPWVSDHLSRLIDDYAATMRIDPGKLGGLMVSGSDPAALQEALAEAGGIEGLIGGEESEGPRQELEAFLGTVTGCARLLSRRAVGELVPGFVRITETRDEARDEPAVGPGIGLRPVPAEATRLGDVFNQEVENRYGSDALHTLWSDPSRMPTASELRDPTEWAARVLLDGWS
ncbi:MAG: zinc-dependent metalloprotease, partial [Acidimicrobiia bacterium]